MMVIKIVSGEFCFCHDCCLDMFSNNIMRILIESRV